MLKALQMGGGFGLRRGARKLRVDVEMPHEDQEALDALRLLSSGYGANSPQYDEISRASVDVCKEFPDGSASGAAGVRHFVVYGALS
jgi:hypothetical protein